MSKALNIARSYATATSASKMVKPPVAVFGVEGKYTNALYSAAAKAKSLDAIENDLKRVLDTFEKDAKFRDFLLNPLVNVAQKKQVLTNVFSNKLKVNPLTSNLVTLMAENNRLKYLPNVAKTFARVMATSRGEVDCVVITAKPITDESQKKELESALKGFTKKKLNITMKTDPSIIGGLMVDFGGEHFIDMSIKSKVKMYTDLIKQPV
ncbi:ATP synthase delta subunit-like protein [Dinothrombium tinctorium]|uniref:Oligomycin sensitivity conferral protein n=1 Tax=Dinothrombium tinctorium TaxID=1965070 RepID=A0A443RFF7_9ACAR|nr:ATP synthase delta subunit-like protein [Dinothrombium tinctorium]